MRQLTGELAAPRKKRSAGAIGALVSVGVCALALLVAWLQRAALVDPLPLPLTLGSGAVGVCAGAWLVWNIRGAMNDQRLSRRVCTMIGMPLFGAAIALVFTQSIVVSYEFTGVDPTTREQLAQILYKRHTRFFAYTALVSFGPGTHALWVNITPELFWRLRFPFRGADCLVLPVQVGRNGWRRILLPRAFIDNPIDSRRYRFCSAQQRQLPTSGRG